MRILSGIFKTRDKPTNATAGSAYRFLLGGSTSGKAVTERSAMQMAAVYSCVRIPAEAVTGLPLRLYRYTDTGGANVQQEIDFVVNDADKKIYIQSAFRMDTDSWCFLHKITNM